MPNRHLHANSDPSLTEERFEQIAELMDDEDAEVERDLATEEMYDTQHGDGHTYNPQQAWEQGLTYTPPDDPPILPSDDPQGADIAAGFAPSLEESNPDSEMLPSELNRNDVAVQDTIYRALRLNSETAELTTVSVRVHNGSVVLLGTVPTERDIALVDEIVVELDGVDNLDNRLEVAA